jgi:signal transduction histidine kinase
VKTFTWRLTLWFSVLVTITTVLLLGAGGWLLHRQIVSSIELMHDVEGQELATLLGPHDGLSAAEIARRIKEDVDSDAELFLIQVNHEDGTVMFRSDNLDGAVLPPPLAGRDRWTSDVPEFGPVRISAFRSGPWQIQLASRLAPVSRVLRDYAEVSGVLIAIAGAISVGLGYGFSRLTLRPVRAIERTAQQIRGDNLGERIPVPEGEDELTALTRLLNQMFDRLEAAFHEVQQFTANASHELKTPLALIRLNADKLRRRVGSDPEALGAVEDLCEEIERLHHVIETLLFLSKAESGVLPVQLRTLILPAWIEDFAEDARALGEDRGVDFVLGKNEPGELRGEPHLLRHLLLNVLSNAIAAMPEGGTVTLDSTRHSTGWRWVLADEGPGLPAADLERVFGRFVRLPRASAVREDERATNAGSTPPPAGSGHGLGLAICRSVVRLHGGTIRAENRTDRRGLRIVVEIPLRPPVVGAGRRGATGGDGRSREPAGVQHPFPANIDQPGD